MKVNRSIRTSGLCVRENFTYIHTTPLLLLLIPYTIINDDIQRKNATYVLVTCAQNQWQKHFTNLKHLLQQSIAHKINVEILKENYKKISVLLQQVAYEINSKMYFLQQPLRNAAKFDRHCDSQISYKTSITLNTVPAQKL